MKKISLLLLLLGLCSTGAFAAAPAGEWWNTHFAYRYKISIPAGASAVPSGYSVAVTFNHQSAVTAGQSLASGDDVRVVRWTGSAWAEVDRVADPVATWNASDTRIWFATQAVINSGATNDNYYLYYGDTDPAAATSPQEDADAVFLFFDDFANGIDANDWDTSGTIGVTAGVVELGRDDQLTTEEDFPVSRIYEGRVRLSDQNTNGSGIFYYWGAANDADYDDDDIGFYANSSQHRVETSVNNAATETAVSVGTATDFQTYAFARDTGNTVHYWVNGAINAAPLTTLTHASRVPSGNLPIALYNDSVSNSRFQYYDWVRVRRYRTLEPVPTIPAVAEQVPVPTLVGEWRLDQTSWSGTGNDVLDSSANAIHGRAYNGATTADTTPPPARSGNPGTCRYGEFDGTNDYVQIADNALLDRTTTVSVSAWVYPRAYGSEFKTIVSKDANYEFHVTSSGRIYWWWGGGAQELTSTASVPLNTWSHVAVSYQSGAQRIYINGVLSGAGTTTGNLTTNAAALQIGQDQGYAGRWFNGDIDEVRVYAGALNAAQVATIRNETHACISAGIDRFVISHPGAALYCAPASITVGVRDAANIPYSAYTQQMTLNTGTGRGSWSRTSGTGAFSDATQNDGIATYTWPGTESSATFQLSYPEGQSAFDIDAYQTTNTAIRDDDIEGNITFAQSAFLLTSGAIGDNASPPFPTVTSPQIAGNSFPIHIAKYGSVAGSAQCRLVNDYAGTKAIRMWSSYANPTTGTRAISITSGATTGAIATSAAASTTVMNVTFTGGRALVTAKYKDAGQLALSVRDQYEATLPTPVTTEGSATFISRPATFVLSNIRTALIVNPGATDATGTVFAKAGHPFLATVEARDAETGATPNYGREIVPESVKIVPTLVQPLGGAAGVISAPIGFGSFASGVASGSDFSWSEVGIITLAADVKDGDYLGTGNVTGTSTGNIGRFIPDNFSVATTVVPILRTGCAAGGFTYVGQPMIYAVSPVVTVTALALGGSTTTNYRNDFFKLTSTDLNRKYQPETNLDMSGLPDTASDPALVKGAGVGTLTFSSGLRFVRAAPVAPFNAQVTLEFTVRDSDLVAYASNPFTIGAPSGIAFLNGAAQRYGRLAFRNAIGSELIKLPLPLRTEHYQSATEGFVVNGQDSCTSGVALSFVGASGNLSTSETCALDTGAPGASAIGCATADVTQRFRSTAIGGDFNLILSPPGAGNGGTVTIRANPATIPAWLQFDWDNSTSGVQGPSGIATFGVFNGTSPRRIYQREDIVR